MGTLLIRLTGKGRCEVGLGAGFVVDLLGQLCVEEPQLGGGVGVRFEGTALARRSPS